MVVGRRSDSKLRNVQRLVTCNGQHFETGTGAGRTIDAAIEFVMQDEVFLCGWWLDLNIVFPAAASSFTLAELSLSGNFKGELMGASATEGETNFGGTLEVLNVELNEEVVTAVGFEHTETSKHCSTMLPEKLWVPLEKQDSVYVNTKDNNAATTSMNVRAGLWMYER